MIDLSKEITVVNNFLTDDDIDYMCNFIRGRQWTIQTSDPDNPKALEFLQLPVGLKEQYFLDLYSRIQDEMKTSQKISDIYFNGQWPGRHGEFHEDNGSTTVLLYISSYHPSWGGFTQFANSNEDQVIVAPLYKRMVYFNSKILHKAYAFAYQHCPLRVSLAYKLI